MPIPAWVEAFKRPVKLGLSVAVMAAAVSLFLPNFYRSEARVLPVESKGMGGNLGNLAAAAAAFGVSVPGGEGSDANFVDILNSRTLRERLLKTEFSFKVRSWRFGGEHEERQTLEQYLEEKNLDRTIKKLAEVLAVSRDLKSKVITISAETKSADLSQQIVRRWLQLLEGFVQEKGRTRGSAKASFSEARLEDSRKEMNQVEDDFRRFLDANRNFALSTDPSVRLRGMRLEAELKLRQQLVTSLALSREQALMEEKNDIPIVNVLDAGNLPIEKSRPTRSVLVLGLFFATTIGSVAWAKRDQLVSVLRVS
ncbi:MAG: hypothetical protein HYZ13_01550 [Acidobacteria bacterium]|nr:hypothetical protein [Acidobacteriota bacterium]